jgi:hypothetical protein
VNPERLKRPWYRAPLKPVNLRKGRPAAQRWHLQNWWPVTLGVAEMAGFEGAISHS